MRMKQVIARSIAWALGSLLGGGLIMVQLLAVRGAFLGDSNAVFVIGVELYLVAVGAAYYCFCWIVENY